MFIYPKGNKDSLADDNHSICRSWQIVIFLLAFLTFFGSSVFAGGDFVYRPEFSMTGPISDRFKWAAAVTSKISIDAQASDEIAFIAGLLYKPNRNMTLSSDIKYITKSGTHEKNEFRPRFCMELFSPAGKFKVALRNRFEYRMKEGENNFWRYRVRIELEFSKIKLATPYLFGEIFYEFGEVDELNRNESGGGMNIPLSNALGLDIELMFQNNKKNDDLETTNIHFFTKFKYDF